MKKVLLVSVIVMILFACNNTKGSARPKVLRRDTIDVQAIYLSPSTGQAESGIIKRIIWDSLYFKYTDTVNRKEKEWRHDSSYLVLAYFTIDSAESIKYKKPIYDSTGKKIQYSTVVEINKKFVTSGWERADSTIVSKLKAQR